MRIQLSFWHIFHLLLVTQQHEIRPEQQTEIDRLLESHMADNNVPGLGLSIIKTNGEVSYTRGYGMANIENNIPVSNGTLFGIGSITKSFTATIVVKTLNEMFPELGQSALDIPIRQLAPRYQFTLMDRYRSEQTSFRDLLAHKVCTYPDGIATFIGAIKQPAEIFYRERYAPEFCSFRNGYVYNNDFIGMAADIIAHVANRSFDDMFQNLLDDIGMTTTTWINETDDHNNVIGRSVPYIWRNGQFQRFNPELLKPGIIIKPAGLLLSTPSDMARYMEFHLNYGRVGERQIVPEAVMKWMYAVSNPIADGIIRTEDNPNATLDVSVGYGLCLEIRLYDGWLRIGHGGYLPPYESYMSLFHNLGLGIFITYNGPGSLYFTGTMGIDTVQSRIFDILNRGRSIVSTNKGDSRRNGRLPYGPFAIQLDPIIPSAKKPSLNMLDDEILGTFGSGLRGSFNITLRNNSQGVEKPYLHYGLWVKGWLDQVSNNSFVMNEWDSDFWMMGWAYGLGMLPSSLEFVDVDNVIFSLFGLGDYGDYTRDLDLEDLPQIPWTPDSC